MQPPSLAIEANTPPPTTFSKVMVLRGGKWVHDGTYNLTNSDGQFVNLSQDKLEIAHGVLYDAGFRSYGPDPVENRGMVVSVAPLVGVLEFRYLGHRTFIRGAKGPGIKFEVNQALYKEMGNEIPMPF